MSRTVTSYSSFVFDTQIKIWDQTDVQGVTNIVRKIADRYQFDGFCLAINRQELNDISRFIRLHDWPEAWIEEYQELGLHQKDPHPHLVRERQSPYLWDHNSFGTNTDASFVLDVAAQYGLRAGLIVPLRLSSGTHALSLHSRETSLSHSLAEVMELNLLATTVADRYLEIVASGATPATERSEKLDGLSAIQKEILRWVAIGKTNWEVATILNLPKRTVDYHVSAILKKLGVASRLQAANVFSRLQI